MAEYVHDEERIIDRPEAEEADNSAYILIGNPTQGLRCITIENFNGGVINEQ